MTQNERGIIEKAVESLDALDKEMVIAYGVYTKRLSLPYVIGLLSALLEQKDEITISTPLPGQIYPV